MSAVKIEIKFMDEMKKCQKCGMAGEGYKCEMCGEEAAEHDPMHKCGGDKCVVKCSGCKEAETKCVCPAGQRAE